MIFETQENYKIKRIGRSKKLYWSLNDSCETIEIFEEIESEAE